ncbi:MAG: mechanosensitive ion channel family protein [Muribaculaceae bacterium]|nr:mechanosensitive ion channel family protein [Muribaculaceae bacterium]
MTGINRRVRACALGSMTAALNAGAATAAADIVKEAVPSSLIPSHDFAMWILRLIRRLMDMVGLSHQGHIEEIVYTAVVFAVALGIGWVFTRIVLFLVRKVIRLRHTDMSRQLLAQKTIKRCSHFITPLVLLCLLPVAFSSDDKTLDWMMRIVGVYTLVTFAMAICAVLEFIWDRFNERENTDKHPLKGILNVGRGLVWIIIVIISVSVLIDKSPMSLLAGLGAFAAALMLIFKDSILGFVAGIQLSNNDMLRVGDWIVVPSTIANGIVMDVTLTVVKVQNWDNTMVMLPPYTLVSTSFQNYRNMFDVGARFIDHNLYIDHSSIVAATPELIASVSEKYPLVKDFIDKAATAKKNAKGNPLFAQIYNDSHGINGTIDTNLGLFRAYACAYLIAHPAINSQTQDMLVSMDPPQSYGVALNINCYSNQTSWAQFEAVKAEVLEHLHAAAPDFGLILFNNPDRNSFQITEVPSGKDA